MDEVVRDLLAGETVEVRFAEEIDPSSVRQTFDDIERACGHKVARHTLITPEGIVYLAHINGRGENPIDRMMRS